MKKIASGSRMRAAGSGEADDTVHVRVGQEYRIKMRRVAARRFDSTVIQAPRIAIHATAAFNPDRKTVPVTLSDSLL